MHVVVMHVTGCVLGLEAFAQEPAMLKKLDSMASGKILLAEILEREDLPLMVLYDTSQEDDININASCLKALQEKSLGSPLQVPSTQQHNTTTKHNMARVNYLTMSWFVTLQ